MRRARPESYLPRILKVRMHSPNPSWSWMHLPASTVCQWGQLCNQNYHSQESPNLHWTLTCTGLWWEYFQATEIWVVFQSTLFFNYPDQYSFFEFQITLQIYSFSAFDQLCLTFVDFTLVFSKNWLWLSGLSLFKGLCFYFNFKHFPFTFLESVQWFLLISCLAH